LGSRKSELDVGSKPLTVRSASHPEFGLAAAAMPDIAGFRRKAPDTETLSR
jgi:hypothetical protein